MQAVILAGGRGERLRPQTDTIPKSMLPVKGKPFLEHQILMLKKAGISDFLLLTGHLSNLIESHFRDGSRLKVRIEYSVESHPLGAGGAIKNAAKLLQNDFLLLSGDTFTRLDYKAMAAVHKTLSVPILMAAYDNHDKLAPSNIRVEPDLTVTGYNRVNPTGMTHIDAGVMVIKSFVFLRMMPETSVFSFEDDVFPKLNRYRLMKAFVTDQPPHDMNNPAHLKKLEELL